MKNPKDQSILVNLILSLIAKIEQIE